MDSVNVTTLTIYCSESCATSHPCHAFFLKFVGFTCIIVEKYYTKKARVLGKYQIILTLSTEWKLSTDTSSLEWSHRYAHEADESRSQVRPTG